MTYTIGSRDNQPARHVHFVGFRDDRYLNAVKVFGEPTFIHIGWDRRALREIGESDVVVFADGPADQEPRAKSFPDILDGSEVNVPRELRRTSPISRDNRHGEDG